MAYDRDSSVVGADGQAPEDTIFTLPAFRVTTSSGTWTDVSGAGNIFDPTTGIQPGLPTDVVSFGPGGSATPPTIATNYLQPMEVKSEIELLYNQILAQRNAVRARQGLPPVSSVDRDDIVSIWDDVIKQQNELWDLAQRDLDRAQAARRLPDAQIGSVLPLPIPKEIADLLNAAQLAELIKRIYDSPNIPTPRTPSEVAATGGDLSEIGMVGRGGTVLPTGTAPSGAVSGQGGIFDAILNAPGNLIGTIGGAVGGLAGITGGGGGGGVAGGTTTPGTTDTTTTTGTTGTVIVTPGAIGGQTDTGSSTPSVNNPGGVTVGQPITAGPETTVSSTQTIFTTTTDSNRPITPPQRPQEQPGVTIGLPIAVDPQTPESTTSTIFTTTVDTSRPITAPEEGTQMPVDVSPNRVIEDIFGVKRIPGTPTNVPGTTSTSTVTGTTETSTATTTVTVTPETVDLTNPGLLVGQCPEGQERINGVCVAKCNPGEVRVNGVCVTRENPTSTECPVGQMRNAEGICVPVGVGGGTETPTNQSCPVGQVRNAQGICVVAGGTDTPSNTDCPAGQVRNAQGICVVAGGTETPTTTDCPVGQVRNAQGICVVAGGTETPTTTDCPAGQVRNAQGVCVVQSTECPAGQERVNGTCVPQCGAGQVRNAAGVCVAVAGPDTPARTDCPAGQVRNAEGVCVVPNTDCGANEERINGVCVPRCTGGQVRNAAGVCVTPGGGGGGTTSTTIFTPPQPSNYTLMPTTVANRDILREGTTTSGAFTQLAPEFAEMYGGLARRYQSEDERRLYAMAQQGSEFANAQQALSQMAAQQTRAANEQLRSANLMDVVGLGRQAETFRRQVNPELYASLGQFTDQARQQAAADYARMGQAGQLSAEDIRNAQQAAREAYAARGQVMSKGAVGAEMLNRQALQQQREQQARANYQQSLANLGAATQMQTQNMFDPFATILGQQYGMQTQNVGTTQGMFGQAGALASGGLAYAPVVQTYNPFGVYPADVYGSNFNAYNADQIAAANRDAALQAARMGQTGAYAQTIGTFFGSPTGQTLLKGVWDYFAGGGGSTRTPGT